jgi:hypothetical protein
VNWFWLLVRRLWWRKFNPVLRLGWVTLLGKGPDDARIGVALIAVGWVLQQLKRPSPVLVYRYEATPGESVRIRVLRGDRVLADRTIEG